MISAAHYHADCVKTYQEHYRDVQEERNHGVHKQSNVADLLDICQAHLWHFNEQRDNAIHDSTSRSEVVERDKRVHLELSARK